jgi:hypothetical protein
MLAEHEAARRAQAEHRQQHELDEVAQRSGGC